MKVSWAPTFSSPVVNCLPVELLPIGSGFAVLSDLGPRLPFPGLPEWCLYQHHSHAQQEAEVLHGEWLQLLQ